MNARQNLGLFIPQARAAGQVDQAHGLFLQPPGGASTGPAHLPARPIAPRVLADEIDLGESAAALSAQHTLDVVVGNIVWAIQPPHPTGSADHPRQAVVKRQTDRIQQRAFAGAGGAGNGENPGAAQRFGFEIHRKRRGQTGEIFPPQGQQPHGNRAPSGPVSGDKAACNTSLKAARSGAGGAQSYSCR